MHIVLLLLTFFTFRLFYFLLATRKRFLNPV